jgi:hypothetical protein
MHCDRELSRAPPTRAIDRVIAWGKKMLQPTSGPSRLFLTAEFRAVEVLPKPPRQKATAPLFASELNRFPPVEDVVAVLDRTALRAFVA